MEDSEEGLDPLVTGSGKVFARAEGKGRGNMILFQYCSDIFTNGRYCMTVARSKLIYYEAKFRSCDKALA